MSRKLQIFRSALIEMRIRETRNEHFYEAADPAAAAAPATPSASVAQSSALQRASEASSLNPLNVEIVFSSNNNVAGDQNKDSTPTIDNSCKNDDVDARKDVLKCSSSFNKTGSVNKTSVNKSNEASAMEGTTIPVVSAEMNPVEYGAGLAVAKVPVPPSEPPTSLPSGALSEAAGSMEPLGPRKASFRKKRTARFNPMEGMAAVRQHSRTPLFSGRSQKK